jgi:hypothetical protein
MSSMEQSGRSTRWKCDNRVVYTAGVTMKYGSGPPERQRIQNCHGKDKMCKKTPKRLPKQLGRKHHSNKCGSEIVPCVSTSGYLCCAAGDRVASDSPAFHISRGHNRAHSGGETRKQPARQTRPTNEYISRLPCATYGITVSAGVCSTAAATVYWGPSGETQQESPPGQVFQSSQRA